MNPHIIRFGTNVPAPETASPDGVVSGNPVTTLYNYYTDVDGRFFAGVWESTSGKWRVHYTEYEFCALLAGKAIVTADDGTSETFSAGDAFVIPAGFTGTWETVESVRKLYAIYQR